MEIDGRGVIKVNSMAEEFLVCTSIEREGDDEVAVTYIKNDRILDLGTALFKLSHYSPGEEVRRVVRKDEIVSPVGRPINVIGVAWNYDSHRREFGHVGRPVFFPINPRAVCGPFGEMNINPENLIDYEVELGLVIGKKIDCHTRISNLQEYIAGYVLANDITSRRKQIEKGRLWWKTRGFYDAKSMPSSKPIGPVIARRVPDSGLLSLEIESNGGTLAERQLCGINMMSYSPEELVGYLAEVIREPARDRETRQMVRGTPGEVRLFNGTGLYPGDVILTGTPSGTAYRSRIKDFVRAGGKRRFLEKELRDNNLYISPGDKIYASGSNLGWQEIRTI
jgi:2,4-didehydro-3-deoxy-L-rhamnonate hydrolase